MKILSIFLIAFWMVHQAAAQSDRELVLKVLNDQQDCWNNADIDCFMEGYWKSDSLMFVGSSGVIYGWQATYDRYIKNYPDKEAMGELQFEIKETKPISPEAYLVVGKFHLTRTIGDLEGFFTLVFKKINGKWLVISDHTS